MGFSGALVGYNGTFNFGSGSEYPEEINYTFMRAFSALFGAAMVPLAYLTCLELKMSLAASILAAVLVLTGLDFYS